MRVRLYKTQENVSGWRFCPCNDHCALRTAHCALLTTHYSLRTTHYALCTTHYKRYSFPSRMRRLEGWLDFPDFRGLDNKKGNEADIYCCCSAEFTILRTTTHTCE